HPTKPATTSVFKVSGGGWRKSRKCLGMLLLIKQAISDTGIHVAAGPSRSLRRQWCICRPVRRLICPSVCRPDRCGNEDCDSKRRHKAFHELAPHRNATRIVHSLGNRCGVIASSTQKVSL